MFQLSDRLSIIAGCIKQGETVADIGTDHGLLPIFLLQNDICNKVILSDIKIGPLEKAKANIQALSPELLMDIRMGNGLDTLKDGEVDTVIIAGMGGLLIRQILEADMDKTRRFSKFILQPRNASEKLRQWLWRNNFRITDEFLVRERNHICEIFVATAGYDQRRQWFTSEIDFEISPLLFEKKDPLLKEFISRKIQTEADIIENITRFGSKDSFEKADDAKKRIEILKDLCKKVIIE